GAWGAKETDHGLCRAQTPAIGADRLRQRSRLQRHINRRARRAIDESRATAAADNSKAMGIIAEKPRVVAAGDLRESRERRNVAGPGKKTIRGNQRAFFVGAVPGRQNFRVVSIANAVRMNFLSTQSCAP